MHGDRMCFDRAGRSPRAWSDAPRHTLVERNQVQRIDTGVVSLFLGRLLGSPGSFSSPRNTHMSSNINTVSGCCLSVDDDLLVSRLVCPFLAKIVLMGWRMKKSQKPWNSLSFPPTPSGSTAWRRAFVHMPRQEASASTTQILLSIDALTLDIGAAKPTLTGSGDATNSAREEILGNAVARTHDAWSFFQPLLGHLIVTVLFRSLTLRYFHDKRVIFVFPILNERSRCFK